MKILHTSDWHLGQSFMGKSREPEHRAFLEWLLQLIEYESVNAVIVAGDIFDTTTPPSYARSLYNEFIVQMHQAGCQLVILGGNHDSVSMLHESASLAQCLGTHVVGGVLQSPAEQVITLKNANTQVGAIVCAIPFIRARDVVESQAGQTGQEKQQALIKAMADHFDAVYREALDTRTQLQRNVPIIATGHLTTLASSKSESVRDIYVGTLESFPADHLPKADYIALGHIHKPMSVAGQAHVRYSGSPIHLSFDEVNHDKQVQLVSFNGELESTVESVTVPRFRQMRTVNGSLAEVTRELESLPASISETALDIWLEISIHTDDYLSGLHQQLENLIEGKPMEILRLRRKRSAKDAVLNTERKKSLKEFLPKDVFLQRLAEEPLEPEQKAKLLETFTKLVTEVEANVALDDSELHRARGAAAPKINSPEGA
ncbi:exonuclease subunit SbcD [Neiella marina]|uniref:Nuclease SbcCD subunit D n=1 Tax=Neiella holothuriorum TaxID=2870530 RepID=A0ABS7EDB8_9GAMM|nr:exonuclease subunit SbcD [Neiella holothuriorum]MBW8190318.1 exonuclease subunit SbcD [Neiella holothuriorum]